MDASILSVGQDSSPALQGPGGLESRPTTRRDLYAVLFLTLIAGLLFFARLRSPLLEPEDAFYAEIPRQMLARGDWLIPTHDGRPYYQKPPLLYWLIMAAYATFGVHDWAARLVPCVFGVGIVLVTFWWGKRSFGFRAGLAGALILCLSPRFVHQARMITMDGPLCFWILCGLALGQQAIEAGRLGWRCWLASAVACALAVLTKGPVALILVCIPLLAYQFLKRRTARPAIVPWLAYVFTALGMVLPWFLVAGWRDAAFFREFFWDHHVALRFVQPLHEQPAWYYFAALLLGMLPWSFLLPDLVKLVIRQMREQRPPEVRILLLASGCCLLFFSAAPCKRIGYILPAMPTLALALGYALDKRLSHNTAWGFFGSDRKSALPYWTTHAVLSAGLVVSLICGFTGLAEPAEGLALAALAIAAMIWLVIRAHATVVEDARWRLAGSWAGCVMMMFLFLLLSIHVLLPGYYRRFSLRAQVRSFVDASSPLQVPVVCHPHHCDSVSFYLGRDDIHSFSREERMQMIADLQSRPETIVFVKTGRVLDELLALLPDSLEFVPRGRASWMTAGLVRRRVMTANIPNP